MTLGIALPGTALGLWRNPVAALFSTGEQGAWYDPSDFSTMFQDSAGTTPVTAVGQPVGLMLDKRLGLAQGANVVTNGAFDANLTGWTTGADAAQVIATWDAGRAKLTRGAGGTGGALTQTFATVSGTWYKLTFTATAGAGGSGVAVRVDSGILGAQVVGAGTKSVFFLATGATAAPAFWNINNNAIDFVDDVICVSVAGNHRTQATAASRPTLRQDASGYYYLEYDGVDDSMATGSVDFSATDKVTAFVGAHKIGTGVVVELSASTDTNNGSFHVYADATYWQCTSKGTTATGAFPAAGNGANQVLTAEADISTPLVRGRVNAGAYNSTVTSQGTGNFGNYPLYFGRRGGSSLPFNGREYQTIIRGAATSDSQIARVERFVASRMGVSL